MSHANPVAFNTVPLLTRRHKAFSKQMDSFSTFSNKAHVVDKQ